MSQSPVTAGPVAEIALTGDLARPARLTVPGLLTWRQHRADVSFECATSGTIDGTSLDLVGPQLVLPQDRCGARHISGINAIRVDGGYRLRAEHASNLCGNGGGRLPSWLEPPGVLVVQHLPHASPDVIGTTLQAAGPAVRVCRVWAGDPVPQSPAALAALVVWGGSPAADEDLARSPELPTPAAVLPLLRAALDLAHLPHHGMTPHISGSSLSAQARYAAGTREILEFWFTGRPIRDEYLIVDGGALAGTGAHSYSVNT